MSRMADLWRLAALELRRCLTPGLAALVLGVACFAATRDWSPPAALEGVPLADATGDEGAYRRQAVWALFLVVAFPLLVSRAAGCAERWRARDADWFAPLPLPRSAYSVSTVAGVVCAAWLLVVGTATITEAFTTSSDTPPLRFHAAIAHPPLALLDDDEPMQIPWSASGDATNGAQLVLHPTVAPGSGPAVAVRFSLARRGDRGIFVERRLFGRTRIALDVPDPDADELELSIERTSDGAVFVLPPNSVELWVPTRSARLASVELGARCALLLAAWIALAAGLGAWMRAGLATALGAACFLLALVGADAAPALAAFVPGADIVQAWGLVGRGVVPPSIDGRAFVGTLLLIAAGVGALHAGIAHGRSAR